VSSSCMDILTTDPLSRRLIRTLNLKVPLTSLEFSPEGAAIYAGTENGKLLITDLRGLDKGPKTIVISDAGSRIESMSIQVCSLRSYP
jgi:protein NEDD1